MTKTEQLMQERDDLQAKIASARESDGASEREASDLKMMEQELLALEQRISRAENSPSPESRDKGKTLSADDKLEKKLDAALKDSFPGSDPVSFIEAAPVKPNDEHHKTNRR
ncbi:hypothetical protein [Reyranella sp.]|uniref:hypothetical protein n=1 Tax=Reyranella sp. TaxID=1929291 RepID=UPI003BA9A2FD